MHLKNHHQVPGWLATAAILLMSSCDNKDERVRSSSRRMPESEAPGLNVSKSGNPDANKQTDRSTSEQPDALPAESTLAGLGNGTQRQSIILRAVNQYTPRDLSRFLVEQQGSLQREDLASVSNLAYRLSLLGRDGLADGLSRIQEPWLKAVFYDALVHHLATLPDKQAYVEIARKIPSAATRQGFLTTYMAQSMRADPAIAMQEIQTLRELNPDQRFTGWYNQLVADTFLRTPANKVETTWPMLETISDKATRTIAAQQLFGALYENDSIAATTWLNAKQDSQDKQQAVSYLVQILTSAGDHESAEAWKALLAPR